MLTRFSASVLLFHMRITRLPKCPTDSFDVFLAVTLCIMEASAIRRIERAEPRGRASWVPPGTWVVGIARSAAPSLSILPVVSASRVGSPGFALEAN